MGTPLQLVAEYYQSVLKCERIFNNNVRQNDLSDLVLARENISLRNKVQQLSLDLQLKQEELDSAKKLHKTQKALLESKLENTKSNLKKLSSEAGSEETERVKFHLLSPIQNERTKSFEREPSRLRQVLDRGHMTLFDDETDDTANRTDDVLFLNSLRPNTDFRLRSQEGGDEDSSEVRKKRKLYNKKIEVDDIIDQNPHEDQEQLDSNNSSEKKEQSNSNTGQSKIKGLFKV